MIALACIDNRTHVLHDVAGEIRFEPVVYCEEDYVFVKDSADPVKPLPTSALPNDVDVPMIPDVPGLPPNRAEAQRRVIIELDTGVANPRRAVVVIKGSIPLSKHLWKDDIWAGLVRSNKELSHFELTRAEHIYLRTKNEKYVHYVKLRVRTTEDLANFNDLMFAAPGDFAAGQVGPVALDVRDAAHIRRIYRDKTRSMYTPVDVRDTRTIWVSRDRGGIKTYGYSEAQELAPSTGAVLQVWETVRRRESGSHVSNPTVVRWNRATTAPPVWWQHSVPIQPQHYDPGPPRFWPTSPEYRPDEYRPRTPEYRPDEYRPRTPEYRPDEYRPRIPEYRPDEYRPDEYRPTSPGLATTPEYRPDEYRP